MAVSRQADLRLLRQLQIIGAIGGRFNAVPIASSLDQTMIRGEYKVWVYKRYLVPSLHFKLAVNPISSSSIKKANALATKCIKSWLGLCRSTTVAVLHHPSVLNIPFLDSYSTAAKLSYLSAVTVSEDPLIKEIASLYSSSAFQKNYKIPSTAVDALSLAKDSVSDINRATFSKATKSIWNKSERHHWDNHLSNLTVQSKFSDACTLELDNKVWSRIQQGLPSGQLSFMLRAASDTLPTPMNLSRWRYKADSKCPLCGSPYSTTLHILNACPTALSQGRYTWRHDSVLHHILRFLSLNLSTSATLYGDIDGHRAIESPATTIPLDLLVTSARPDIVLIDKAENVILIIELTIPFNSQESFDRAHAFKTKKYTALCNDLEHKGFSVNFMALEIGALGHYSRHSISLLHRLLSKPSKSDIRSLLDQSAKIAIAASYKIFISRRESIWSTSLPLLNIN